MKRDALYKPLLAAARALHTAPAEVRGHLERVAGCGRVGPLLAALPPSSAAMKKPIAGDIEPDAASSAILLTLERRVGLLGASLVDQEDALLADVYRAPADDAPRLVYADWLSALGDPRGEFIAMQLATARGARTREADLLRAHGELWLGPLGSVEYPVFRRGFVAQCRSGAETEHPAWATVEVLETKVPWRAELSSALRGLRQIGALEWSGVAALEVPIRHVGVEVFPDPKPDELERVARLRHLERIDVITARSDFARVERAFEGLLAQPGCNVAGFGVCCEERHASLWLEWFLKHESLVSLHLGLGHTWRHLVTGSVDVTFSREMGKVAVTFRLGAGKQEGVEAIAPWAGAIDLVDFTFSARTVAVPAGVKLSASFEAVLGSVGTLVRDGHLD